MSRPSSKSLVVLLILVTGFGAFVAVPPAGPRSMRAFNPSRTADLELRMWQAYYAKERVRLFALLVTMLHEQYRYSWATAASEGFHLAKAAATFGDLRTGYEVVLPDIEAAYRQAKNWTHAGFDPAAVARAELAWWVARRMPGQNSPSNVGALMANEYALLYEAPREDVYDAALLRAEAAALRDSEAGAPDWDTIGRLLRDSYVRLLAALSTANG